MLYKTRDEAMFKKLVKCNRGYFEEVDPIRLKRKAIRLRNQIFQKISKENDFFHFYSLTMPLIDAAIEGQIIRSLDRDSTKVINGNFKWNEREGTLPAQYDSEFQDAVAGFSIAIRGAALEKTDDVVIDGVIYRWLDLEEESDWPDKMKFP